MRKTSLRELFERGLIDQAFGLQLICFHNWDREACLLTVPELQGNFGPHNGNYAPSRLTGLHRVFLDLPLFLPEE